MDGTKINCIVPTIKWDLKLKVISVILRRISNFADELSDMSMGLPCLLSLLLCLDKVAAFYTSIISLLSQTCDLFLSNLSSGLPALHLS